MKASSPVPLVAMVLATCAFTRSAPASTITDPGVIITAVDTGTASITWDASKASRADVEHSTDLSGWTKVSTNNSAGEFQHVFGNATKGFYRLKWTTPLNAAQQAAESALEEALAIMRANIPNDLSYTTGSETTQTGTRTYIQPASGLGGYWSASGSRGYLDSGQGGEHTVEIALFGDVERGLVQQVNLKTLFVNSNPQETARYGYWIDDNTTKQNLSWWGGGGPRGSVTNIWDLPFVFPTADGLGTQPPPTGFADAVASVRTISFSNFSVGGFDFIGGQSTSTLSSIDSYSLLDPAAGGLVNRYFFTKQSLAGFSAPNGQPRLNLAKLRTYINSTPTDQGAGQPRAQLVDALLDLPSPLAPSNWGGGNLTWLTNTGKYKLTEAKQIAATLIDYLDDDFIPTTDSVEQPTYLGVEMKLAESGAVLGHPVINFVTVGLVFNRTFNFRTPGEISSTRVLCSVGAVYPWSESSSTSQYEPEITIAVEGDVVNGLTSLGSQANAYFLPTLSEQLTTRPVATFEPFSGYNFPTGPGMAGTTSYATRLFGFTSGDWPTRLPANIQFNDLRFSIRQLRVKYTADDGATGYVFVLPKDLTIKLEPASIAPGGGAGSLLVKTTLPEFANTKNLYLSSDPRAHFLANSWTNLASDPNFGTNVPTPAEGVEAIDTAANVGTDGDGAQGVPMNFEWFKSASLTNHLARSSFGGMESIGEIGYLWAGKPWQTLNLTDTNNPATADWNLMDYLSAGASSGRTVLPLRTSWTSMGSSITRDLLADGGISINTRKLPTLNAVFSDAAGISAVAAEGLSGITEQPDWPVGDGSDNVSAYGAIARLNEALVDDSATKFQREAPQRAIANVVVNNSRSFTIYAVGEHEREGAVSRAILEADVFVGTDPATGTPVLRVLDKSYR